MVPGALVCWGRAGVSVYAGTTMVFNGLPRTTRNTRMAPSSTADPTWNVVDPGGDRLTARVIGAFFDVYRELGHGFLEAVYLRAMAVALRDAGLDVATEVQLPVRYRGVVVGDYRADLVVASALLIELKAVDRLVPSHRAQVINYLKATRIERALLMNCGPRPSFERIILTNDRKRATGELPAGPSV